MDARAGIDTGATGIVGKQGMEVTRLVCPAYLASSLAPLHGSVVVPFL